jgi:hypothetical protein
VGSSESPRGKSGEAATAHVLCSLPCNSCCNAGSSEVVCSLHYPEVAPAVCPRACVNSGQTFTGKQQALSQFIKDVFLHAVAVCWLCTAGSKLKPPGLQVAGSTAPFTVGLSPQAEAERAVWLAEERARQEAFQQVESAKLRRTIEDQLRVELNDVLAKSSRSWRDIFCCCFPKRMVSTRQCCVYHSAEAAGLLQHKNMLGSGCQGSNWGRELFGSFAPMLLAPWRQRLVLQ